MRAVVLNEEGDADVVGVHDVADARAGDGQMLVHLRCSALNHLDVWIRKGMPSVPKPRIMGGDGMGVLAEGDRAGERVLIDPSITCGVCEFCLGGDTALCDTFRVLGEHLDGTHAEAIAVPRVNVHPVPAHLSDEQAAALPLVFGTAWRMLVTRVQLRAPETVLVWGASAGVGAAAVQLANALGARVIATSRSDDKLAVCRELGAHDTINSSGDVAAAVKELTSGRGVDVVFDHLGEVAYEPSLKSMRKGGRYVTCGATTGARPPAQLTRLFWKQFTVMGSTMASKRDFAQMLRFVALHGITPRVDRVFELEQIADAHRHLESASHVGKVVMRIAR